MNIHDNSVNYLNSIPALILRLDSILLYQNSGTEKFDKELNFLLKNILLFVETLIETSERDITIKQFYDILNVKINERQSDFNLKVNTELKSILSSKVVFLRKEVKGIDTLNDTSDLKNNQFVLDNLDNNVYIFRNNKFINTGELKYDTLYFKLYDNANNVYTYQNNKLEVFKLLSGKLDKPTTNNTKEYVILGDGSTKLITEIQTVKSVNNKTGDVVLKLSDLENDKNFITSNDLSNSLSGYVSNTTLESIIKQLTKSLDTKLDKPTEEGTTEDYPFVVGVNEDNESAKLPAGDLGKNFANTDLEVTENRKHTGNGSVEFGMPLVFSNTNQQFKNLPDKSADATYNQFALFDSNGNLAKVSQIANAFERGLQNTTAEQALRIGTLLGGGSGDAGAMSVNMISPYVIQNRFDNVEYVLLRGANLKLGTSRKIEILNKETQEVVAIIPNSQVISESSTELTFYFNFYQFAIGTYVIRLTSGVKVYTTSQEFMVLQEVEDIDINSISYEYSYYDISDKKDNDVISGRTLVANSEKSSIASQTQGFSFKSNELFKEDEDFCIELSFSVETDDVRTNNDFVRTFIGIGDSSSPVNYAVNNAQTYVAYRKWINDRINTDNNTIVGVEESTSNTPKTFTIIKTGNLLRCIYKNSTTQMTVSNNGGYSLFIQIPKRDITKEILTLSVIKAFKFN